MATGTNTILLNTASQICQTLSEGYCRLTGSYVGPLNSSACATSGFTVQDANKQTGLHVTNTSIQFYKNDVQFNKVNQDVCFSLCSGRSLYITGGGSLYAFDCRGTFSAGSGVNPTYRGIQAYSLNPSLVLQDTGASPNQALRFLNSGGTQDFYICQNGTGGLNICSCDVVRFSSRTVAKGLTLSGCSLGINSDPVSSASLFVSGVSCFNGNLNVSGNQFNTGSICISNFGTGLYVDSKSFFRNDLLISGKVDVSGGNITTDRCVVGTTGFFSYLCVTSGICLNGAYLSNLCVIGGASCCAEFSVCSKFRCGSDHVLINATGINIVGSLTGCSLTVCNNLISSGNFCGISQSGRHTLNGCCLSSYLTGAGWNFSTRSNHYHSGNLYVTGYGSFSSLNVYGCCANTICGSLCVSDCITTPNLCVSNIVTGYCAIITNCFTAVDVCVGKFCQTNTQDSCFLSNLNIGNLCTGAVGALNTVKAWGIFGIRSGMILGGYTGFNFNGISNPSPLTNASFGYLTYGVKFKTPIIRPVFGMTIMPTNFCGTGVFNAACSVVSLDTPRIVLALNCGNTSCTTNSYIPLNQTSSFFETLFTTSSLNTTAANNPANLYVSGNAMANNMTFTGMFFVYGQ